MNPAGDPGGDQLRHVVMFSGGTGSWGAARRVADEQGTSDMVLLFADVQGREPSSPHMGEDDDTYRFLIEAFEDIGAHLIILNEGRDIWQVFRDKRFIGNTRVSVCSRILKQEPARQWLKDQADPGICTVYVGIDWTEQHRLPAIQRNYAPFTVKAPLCEPPFITKQDLLDELTKRGIEPPRLYAMGFPHGNCGGFCVRAGHAQFALLLEQMPDRYAYHEQQEADLRKELGKDIAILRDRRGGKVRPLTLTELRRRIQSGTSVDATDLGGCGCFTDDIHGNPNDDIQEAA